MKLDLKPRQLPPAFDGLNALRMRLAPMDMSAVGVMPDGVGPMVGMGRFAQDEKRRALLGLGMQNGGLRAGVAAPIGDLNRLMFLLQYSKRF